MNLLWFVSFPENHQNRRNVWLKNNLETSQTVNKEEKASSMKSVQHLLGLNFQLVEKLQRIKEVETVWPQRFSIQKKKEKNHKAFD